jgi:hypothetical protein
MNRYPKAISNCPVWTPEDDTYVSQMTALDTKKKELADRELTNADENQSRVKSTASKRKNQDSVRPI